VDRWVGEGGSPLPDGIITAETPPGFELNGVRKRAAIQLMGSRAWGRFNPNHWDPVYAAETGLSAPIQTGEMSTAYIAEMCVYAFGRHFFQGTRVNLKYIASVYAGETIATHGVIRDRVPVEGGVRFVTDVWAENDAGEKKTVGIVEVLIPDAEREGMTR
jgi:acyl dehydratase